METNSFICTLLCSTICRILWAITTENVTFIYQLRQSHVFLIYLISKVKKIKQNTGWRLVIWGWFMELLHLCWPKKMTLFPPTTQIHALQAFTRKFYLKIPSSSCQMFVLTLPQWAFMAEWLDQWPIACSSRSPFVILDP